jgi:hypothetical protein
LVRLSKSVPGFAFMLGGAKAMLRRSRWCATTVTRRLPEHKTMAPLGR